MRLISTQTDDGLELAGLLAEPDAKNTLIVHVHGMQGNFYEHAGPYAEAYATKGISFLAGENRGADIVKWFDTNSAGKVIGGAYEVFEDCCYDIKAWVDYAERLGYRNVWLSGHSLGAIKTAYYLCQTKDPRIAGLIFLSPPDNQGLVRDPDGAADHAVCYPEAQRLRAGGQGHQLLSHMLWGDKVLSADTYVNLFSEESPSNIFHYYDPNRSWAVVNEISVPVMAFSGTKDDGIVPVMDPHEAMTLLVGQLIRAPKVKTEVLDNAEHSFKGFEAQIVDHAASFISSSPKPDRIVP